MTVNELEKYFDNQLSPTMSCDWDNDGLMLCADSAKKVKSALLSLDITKEAVKKAIELNVDAVFTHHPFIFKPMRSLCDTSQRAKLIFELVKSNIAVFSYHTRLDAADGGVNDILCECVGIKNIRKMGEGELALGRIGDINPTSIDDFSRMLKNKLSAQSICVARASGKSDMISRVAVIGGACDREYVYAAIDGGADLLLTGDASYNLVLDANMDGLSIVCAGHYASENPVLSYYEKELSKLDIKTICYNCGYFEYI